MLICFKILSFWASPTISLEDDSDVVLDKGADVEQHCRRVNSAETELYVICCVIVPKAEVVIVRVDPVGPCCFIWYRLLSYVVPQPWAKLKISSDVLEKISGIRSQDAPMQSFLRAQNSPLWQ